jgi:hypothetical protein
MSASPVVRTTGVPAGTQGIKGASATLAWRPLSSAAPILRGQKKTGGGTLRPFRKGMSFDAKQPTGLRP